MSWVYKPVQVEVTGCHGYGHGFQIWNPRKTHTRDTGLTGITGIAGDCYCYITGCSSLFPSISNHILTSGDLENEDSQREEQQRQQQGGHPRCALSYYNYLLTTTEQQKYEKLRGGLVPPRHFIAIAHRMATITGASDNRRPTAAQTRRKTMLQGGWVPPCNTVLLFSTQQGGVHVHLLVVSFLVLPIFNTVRRYPPPC